MLEDYAVKAMLGVFTIALGVVGYFLRKRDEKVDKILSASSDMEERIEEKIDQVLEVVQSMNNRLTIIEENFKNQSKIVSDNQEELKEIKKWLGKVDKEVAVIKQKVENRN